MIIDKIISLTRQLYPKGRAFKMPDGSYLERLHRSLGLSEKRFIEDALSVLHGILPDNENFTADDATAWERRLGLITNESVPLADRKLAIQRKMNHPGRVKARQSHLFLQKQLRDAGFDVYVFENRFLVYPGVYETMDPSEFDPSGINEFQHGDFEHGEQQHGGNWGNIVVNHIDEERDESFDVGENLRDTFFIGGTPVGTYANVDEERKDEFRQLILKVKAAHTVGYLFINYI